MAKYFTLLTIVLSILGRSHAQAEYRVYRLGVKYDPKGSETRLLTSLDNLQYATYYKITPTQQVRLIEHWMCRGRTDQFKKYCSKPVSKLPKPLAVAKSGPPQPPAQSPQVQKPKPAQVPAPKTQQPVPVLIQ